MKKITVLLFALLLTGCATMHYGNFVPVSQAEDVYLAKDSVSQLTRVYPPAQNTFCIGQKISDGFGVSLMSELRKKGYGLIERNCPKQKANFFYVVDTIKPINLYRVSLYVGEQTLNRVYAKNKETLQPISDWSYKE